jgi:inhibitor of cysteine peptidase
MRKALLVVLVLALLVPLAACSGGGTKKLSDDDSGKSVQLKTGEKLEITLKSNPTTGYRWDVVSPKNDILKLAGEPQFKADSKAIGAGGKTTFVFEATSAGKATLKLVYHRSWEKKAEPAKTFEVTVEVK